jgi:NPCBM/NEW2 domain
VTKTWIIILLAWATLGVAWTPGAWAVDVDVEHLDGSHSRGRWSGVDGGMLRIDAEGAKNVDLSDVRLIRFLGSDGFESTFEGDTLLVLSDGGRLWVRIASMGLGTIVADSPMGEGVAFSVGSLAGLWRGGREDQADGKELFEETLRHRLAGKDVLISVRDGESMAVRASVVGLSLDGGTIKLGRVERSFGFDRVRGIVFATGLAPGDRWPTQVGLSDGSEFAGKIVGSSDVTLRLAGSFGTEVDLPIGAVASLSFASDRLQLVSALPIDGESNVGFLHPAARARIGACVTGGALSLDGRVYENGIGVRARSRLRFEIGGEYERFVATIGLDDSVRPRGSVVFEVHGDGRMLFESGVMTGRDESRLVSVDLAGVSVLELVVTEADGLDYSDHADWCDARLIRPVR